MALQMTLQEIYELGIKMAIEADPRGAEGIKKLLLKAKKDYQDLPLKKKRYFDQETLKNPYSDSRILFGDRKLKVKKVMAGIDADASEVLLMDRLNNPPSGLGLGIDLLISHHPGGYALAGLHEVMEVQVDIFAQSGVPKNVAYALLQERKGKVHRKLNPLNHSQSVDAAKLLGVPLLALHTIWDNLGDKFMKDYLKQKKFETAGEVLEYINEIPEFIESTRGKSGPFLASGSDKDPVGKLAVEFTGGTNPSKELYMEMAKAGVGTIVTMHISEESIDELRKLHVNVIDTGHMAADSIGSNLFLDELEKRGVTVVPCSGLIRIKRKK